MPNAALRLSVFIRTAFTPSTTEPVIRKRSATVEATTSVSTRGRCGPEAVLEVDVPGRIPRDAQVERRSERADVMYELPAGRAVCRRGRRNVDQREPASGALGRGDSGGVGECPNASSQGGHLARTGWGADHDLERGRASGRKCALQCRIDAIRARVAGELAGVGGKELDRRERQSERDQSDGGEQCDPAGAGDHEPCQPVPQAGFGWSRVAVGGTLEPPGREGVDAWSEQREHGRQNDERQRCGDERDDGAREPHREEEVLGEDCQRSERRRDRHRAERDRPARGGDRPAKRVDAEPGRAASSR